MEPVRLVEHNGASILYFDFSEAKTQSEALARVAAAEGAAARYPAGSVLTLTNVTGAYVDGRVVQALGALAQANRPYIKAAAVVGADGQLDSVRQLLAGMARREFATFAAVDAALDWLATQA